MTLGCAALVLAIGCYPGPLVEHANRASRAARQMFTPRELDTAAKTPRHAAAADDLTASAQR